MDLFNNSAPLHSSDYAVSNVTIIIIQIQQDGKKSSVADFGVANQNWPTWTEEQHEKAQSGYPVTRLKFQPSTS